ncbi:MAG: nucleotide exchange factor GrpE [Candidatus Diapherotrites archaeon]|nr:nucleotide exchange factor GrpE [Candidatus Diapherotrites archaeon]
MNKNNLKPPLQDENKNNSKTKKGNKEETAEKTTKTKEQEEKINELEEQLQRTTADFENYKKWVDRQTSEQIQFAGEKILKKLIDFYDDLERVINASKIQSSKEIIEGLELLDKKFKKLLEEENVKPMNCIGQQFDPYFHEAFAQEKGKEENIILEELQKGYFLNSHVLRHAKVKVSQKQKD